MKAFALLLETLHFEPSRNRKLQHIVAYLATTPDPDRGYALAALCQALVLDQVKPALLRGLIEERVDPQLFRLSYDFVGDLSETIALLWPESPREPEDLRFGDVVELMRRMSRAEAARILPQWLDRLSMRERWALLKLVTGALRVGVSAGLAKQALALWSGEPQAEIEEVWHAFAPPYQPLFAWLEGETDRPSIADATVFHAPMLAQPITREALTAFDPADFAAEWKWDGIRVQLRARDSEGRRMVTLFSRSGDDITASFPDLVTDFPLAGTIDAELVATDLESGEAPNEAASFSALQQRLNRKTVTPAIMRRYPARLIAYDLLHAVEEPGRVVDCRSLAFAARRQQLEALVEGARDPRLSISPLVPFSDWEALAAEREASAQHPGIEGVMLKRRAGPYLAGRPQGEWFKWKRDPYRLDCVMMYAQRGHGKRASLYSDFTFGLWEGERLLPVGKAYFGFTDAELAELDRFVRHNTINRFGPVREVAHGHEDGLVLEIAFEGVQRSTRHKSGYAMRFPRVARIRRDKRPHEADRLETLAALAS